MPQEVVDEIPASFLDITFNHFRTIKFYDVLLEEVEMHLIKVLLAKSPTMVKILIKPRQMETNESLNVFMEITKSQWAHLKQKLCILLISIVITILLNLWLKCFESANRNKMFC